MVTTHVKIACVVFCKNINLNEQKFLTKAIDCSIVQMPPNAIRVEHIIVFKSWTRFNWEIERVPFVISKNPFIIDKLVLGSILNNDKSFAIG